MFGHRPSAGEASRGGRGGYLTWSQPRVTALPSGLGRSAGGDQVGEGAVLVLVHACYQFVAARGERGRDGEACGV